MAPKHILWAGLALWAVFMSLSVIAPMGNTEVGLGGGINRATAFFKYQIFAALVGIFLVFHARQFDRPALRWLARLPGLVALALVLVVAGSLLWASYAKPPADAYVPPGKETAPADG